MLPAGMAPPLSLACTPHELVLDLPGADPLFSEPPPLLGLLRPLGVRSEARVSLRLPMTDQFQVPSGPRDKLAVQDRWIPPCQAFGVSGSFSI